MGTGITWIHSVGRSHGKANVYIDGALKATVDLYASSTKEGVKWGVTGLASGKHSIRIVTLGTKRAAATGISVTVDALTVR